MLSNLKETSPQSTPHQNISKNVKLQPVLLVQPASPSTKANECAIKLFQSHQDESITGSEKMEVSIDPRMYLDEESIVIEDDEETVSATEAKIENARLMTLNEENNQESVEKIEKKSVCLDDVQFETEKDLTSFPELFLSETEIQNDISTSLISSTSSLKVSSIECAIEKTLRKKKFKDVRLRSKRKKIIIRINPSPSKRNIRDRAKVLQSKFSCAICKKSLSSKRNVEIHHEKHKEANGKFRCSGEGCKKIFGKLENFLKHQAVHEKPVRRRKTQNEK